MLAKYVKSRNRLRVRNRFSFVIVANCDSFPRVTSKQSPYSRIVRPHQQDQVPAACLQNVQESQEIFYKRYESHQDKYNRKQKSTRAISSSLVWTLNWWVNCLISFSRTFASVVHHSQIFYMTADTNSVELLDSTYPIQPLIHNNSIMLNLWQSIATSLQHATTYYNNTQNTPLPNVILGFPPRIRFQRIRYMQPYTC